MIWPRPVRASADPTALARVEPQAKELMSLARPASLLPSWARSIRANQAGGYLSALKGRGMEYDESRPYQAGDDFRTLDWRVTARTGKPHTKVFREERERPVYICADFSPSMLFATRGVFKSVQAARAAALLAWKAQQSGDRVGGLVFSANAHFELPPEGGKPAVIRIVKKLVEAARLPDNAADRTNANSLPKAIARLKRMAKPGSLIFILSDFRDTNEACESDIAHLARHNDVTLVFVYDPFEAALPNDHASGRVSDGTGELQITLGRDSASRRYAENFTARSDRIAKLCRDYRILFTRLATNDDPLGVLQRVLGR
jgi:uncharacterized protein (DUF58 family)